MSKVKTAAKLYNGELKLKVKTWLDVITDEVFIKFNITHSSGIYVLIVLFYPVGVITFSQTKSNFW